MDKKTWRTELTHGQYEIKADYLLFFDLFIQLIMNILIMAGPTFIKCTLRSLWNRLNIYISSQFWLHFHEILFI